MLQEMRNIMLLMGINRMIFKILMITFVILFIYSNAITTEVSGQVSGVWEKSKSPYYIIDDIIVLQNDSLTIEPGVNIIFNGNYDLNIQGSLYAIGTVTDSIRFSSPQTWKSIRLENEEIKSYFQHAVISDATTAIHSIGAPFEISYSRIYNIHENAINCFGINNPAEIYIHENIIHDIARSAIQINQNSNVNIERNLISFCGKSLMFMGAIHISNQTANGESNPTIYSNKISNNIRQGITAWDITNNSRVNPIIQDNIIEDNYTGIYLLHSSGYVKNNIVKNNYVSGDANSGAGIMISGASARPIITRNTITGNYTGFFIVDNAVPIIGNYENPLDANTIMNNIDATNKDWSIYLFNSSEDIDARVNIFTTNDIDLISESIFDKNDNPTLGLVNFSGFLDWVKNEDISKPITTFDVNLYPNPIVLNKRNEVKFDISLSKEENIEIIIYNVRGQKIDTIYSGMPDSKRFYVNMNLNLASGVYFYKMLSNDYTITKKFIVIKGA